MKCTIVTIYKLSKGNEHYTCFARENSTKYVKLLKKNTVVLLYSSFICTNKIYFVE